MEDGLFASTPPLEALRYLISDATENQSEVVIMINDVSKAFFEAPMRRYVCVELPDEAKTAEEAAIHCVQRPTFAIITKPTRAQTRQIHLLQGGPKPCYVFKSSLN